MREVMQCVVALTIKAFQHTMSGTMLLIVRDPLIKSSTGGVPS